MSELSVEEIVAWIERRLNDGMSPVYLPAHLARALIADWRKRGDALLPFADAVDDYGRHKGGNFLLPTSLNSSRPAPFSKEPRNDRDRSSARYRRDFRLSARPICRSKPA